MVNKILDNKLQCKIICGKRILSLKFVGVYYLNVATFRGNVKACFKLFYTLDLEKCFACCKDNKLM